MSEVLRDKAVGWLGPGPQACRPPVPAELCSKVTTESLKDVEPRHDMFKFVFQKKHVGGIVAMNGRVRLELGKMVRGPVE